MDVLAEWLDSRSPTPEWVASLSARQFGLLRLLLLRAAEELLQEFRDQALKHHGRDSEGTHPAHIEQTHR